jgi:hypothetical protein
VKKIFSIPLNPKLNEQQFTDFYNFCVEYKEFISDVYFTCRIPPFNQDAMGDVFTIVEEKNSLIENAFNLQNHLGIPISATFNNTTVAPTQQNLDRFIKNFKPLYDAGVHIVTIPHTHWMATGQIKAAFPRLFVKNTILRDVRTAVEVVNLAKYGFDYINLDRDLMRDRDTLLRLKQAKKWIKDNLNKDVQFSLLANEGCLGSCPMMVEHFEFNNTRKDESPQYFNDPISRVSCPKWEIEDPAVFLKTASLPPWRSDWQEFLDDLGIDVFKMHGRESIDRLYETMMLVERYAKGEELLYPEFDKWLHESNLEDKPIKIWRDKIKNCKFDCWECQYCDKIEEKKSPWKYSDMAIDTANAIADSGIPKVKNDIPGLTSLRVKTLLNSLGKFTGSYLEIGSYLGATGCAVLQNNYLKAYFVDNWQQSTQPSRSDIVLPTPSKEEFEKNIEKYNTNKSPVTIFDCDLFEVPVYMMNNEIQLFFYDGPHDKITTSQAVQYYWSCFQDEAILVFDDANWEGVVEGANSGIESMNGQIIYKKLILNSIENPNEWWNGLYVTVIRKTSEYN